MKRILTLLLLVSTLFLNAQNNKYQFYLNLNKIKNDLIQIELTTPKIESETVVYIMPKIVPGTYEIYNFGQYVSDFKAMDSLGQALNVNRIDINKWEISNASNMTKISYWVEDTWDADAEDFVFEPGGTNIEKGKNIVLNNHGFFGYFHGKTHYKYEINITRPINFYGTSGLSAVSTSGNVDVFTTANYMDLVDAPIMYNVPDTLTFNVGGAEILISVYSKNKTATAKELGKDIKAILELQSDYLGGKLPIDKYAFIIYLYEGQSSSGGSGALEHSYSSFYYLPEMSAKELSGFLVDVAAHEFFHIVTPLNIHSEEIGNFDFINPQMSKHLWLYEGVTEYFAGHVQVYGGMETPLDYLSVIKGKLIGSNYFNDSLAFTELSLGCLKEHKGQYGNVYEKGALIGLCLDILLRDLSGGEVGLKDIMALLSEKYGKNKSFKDDELFDEITKLTAPEVRLFFKAHVENNTPLPLKSLLNKVGISYGKNVKTSEITLGGVSLGFNPETNRFYINKVSNMNAFGKSLGYKMGDEIISIDGIIIDSNKAEEQFDNFKVNTKEGYKVIVEVLRRKKGKEKRKKLKAKALLIETYHSYLIEFNKSATERELELRKVWLGQ